MLFVPYSSTILTMFWRIPDRIEATTMATVTPMTMPSMVRALRNLFTITLSSAIRNVSRGKNLGSFNFIYFVPSLVPRERDDGVEARSLEGRVYPCDHADAGRDAEREDDVADRDGHRDGRQHRHRPRDARGREQPEHAAQRAEQRRLDEELK